MQDPAANALIDLLNAAAERLLDLDPDGKRALAQLQGSVFCVEITAPPLTLYLLPSEQGLTFRREVESPPDVTLSGTALALAALARSSGAAGGAVSVRGDAELGQSLRKILAELDLDWEELLSRHIGDTPARKAGNILRRLAGWAEDSLDLTRANAADYLTEEKRLLATGLAIERFDQSLDRTRADVDRLERRVQRLARELAQRPQVRT